MFLDHSAVLVEHLIEARGSQLRFQRNTGKEKVWLCCFFIMVFTDFLGGGVGYFIFALSLQAAPLVSSLSSCGRIVTFLLYPEVLVSQWLGKLPLQLLGSSKSISVMGEYTVVPNWSLESTCGGLMECHTSLLMFSWQRYTGNWLMMSACFST